METICKVVRIFYTVAHLFILEYRSSIDLYLLKEESHIPFLLQTPIPEPAPR